MSATRLVITYSVESEVYCYEKCHCPPEPLTALDICYNPLSERELISEVSSSRRGDAQDTKLVGNMVPNTQDLQGGLIAAKIETFECSQVEEKETLRKKLA